MNVAVRQHPDVATTARISPRYAAMDHTPRTDQAHALVSAVFAMVLVAETRERQRGPEATEKAKLVLAYFLADLMLAAGSEAAKGWAYKSLKNQDYSGEPIVSARRFRDLVEVLHGLDLIHRMRGSIRGFVEHVDDEVDEGIEAEEVEGIQADGRATKPRAAHFKATARLLTLASEHGVLPEQAADHFYQELPRFPIVLREASRLIKGKKVRGSRINVRTRKDFAHLREPVAALEAELRRLNTFLDGFPLGGGEHRGYVRVFNLADQADFRLNLGGRVYSQGGEKSYQQLSKDDRKKLTIDGDEVVEMDIKASYLTVLHGRLGLEFDARNDPYEAPTLPALFDRDGGDLRRWVVKQWVVATLGHSKHHDRWPSRVAMEFREKTGAELGRRFPIASVRDAMVQKFPILEQWGSLGVSWADLMYLESEAVLTTMTRLMNEKTLPSYSVHDSLIVRRRDLEVALEVLGETYGSLCAITPVIEVG